MIQVPALLEQLCELGDANEVGRALLQGVKTDRNDRISRINDDQLVTKVTAQPPLSCVDRSQEKWRCVPVQIEVNEPTVCLNVLLAEIPKQRALTASRLPKDGGVHRAPSIA